MRITFLGLDEVLSLHADLIERYGGKPGIRDMGLLQSAAAYLWHLVRNHPFLDGNKRAGLMAMLAFLD